MGENIMKNASEVKNEVLRIIDQNIETIEGEMKGMNDAISINERILSRLQKIRHSIQLGIDVIEGC